MERCAADERLAVLADGVLRAAISRVTEDPRYRAAAGAMAAGLAAERDDNRAIDELEQVAADVPGDR